MTAIVSCERCGAAVGNVRRHMVWHDDLERSLGDARLTREELDYLRDQLADGELERR